MTSPSEIPDSLREKAREVYDRLGRGSAADEDAIHTALLAVRNEASSNLIAIISDIREKSGVGGKPMLGELADAIAARIEQARNEAIAEEREACAREADEHRRLLHGQNVILDISREDAALNIIAAAIRARASK
jgi:hypothetical protein